MKKLILTNIINGLRVNIIIVIRIIRSGLKSEV